MKVLYLYRFFFIGFMSLFLVPLNVSTGDEGVPEPRIDGEIGNGEWINGDKRTFSMTDGTMVESTVKFNDTHIFVLSQVTDDDPTLFSQKDSWDVFGIEFDVNGDQVPMGMLSSPDDALFISYSTNGGQDFLLQGMGNPAIEDTAIGATNDCVGKIGFEGNELIVEACKKLDSGDQMGADIALQRRMDFNVMFAYWDNKDPHTQTTAYSDWNKYHVPQEINQDTRSLPISQGLEIYIFQIITEITIIIALIFV
ncbi:MAG: hypothetical protein ACW991_06205, partial [Candidatus Hodarchaeales archaeon]